MIICDASLWMGLVSADLPRLSDILVYQLLRFKLYFVYEVFREIPIMDLHNRIALKVLYSLKK